jgi:NADH-quinone oxidoreductase subunit L
MVMALGLGGMTAGMYHLTTHAFFKALLFLGAGAMIHSLHTQDIWEMGGLLKKMPVTAITFIIGTLALCGIFPLSGFFSKDEILALAFEHNKVLYCVALFTAGLTAFYMTRAVWVAVLGHERAHKHSHGHGGHGAHFHDASWIMKTPLVVLAVLSVIGGFLGIPQYLTGHAHGEELNMAVALTSTVVALAGIALGTLLYAKAKAKEDPVQKTLGGAYQILVKKYYLDEFFQMIADVFQKTTATLLFWFDGKVIMEKGVNGVAFITAKFGSGLRRLQTGNIQNYALTFGFGLAGLIFFALLRRH